MSIHRPLGATASNGTLELPGHAWPTADVPTLSRRGAAALLGLLAGALIIVLSAADTDTLLPQTVRPVPPALAGALHAGAFHLSPVGLVSALALMFVSYAVVVALADRLPARAVVGLIVALVTLVMLGPALLSTDVFSYQAYARMWANYGINPYYHGPHVIALDQVYPYIDAKWVTSPTVYGPVFTLLSGLFAPLSIAAGVLAFKGVAAAAMLGTVALLWSAARARGVNPVRAVALFGLNPLVLLYGLGGGHNDLLMVLGLTAAAAALVAARPAEGGAFVALAAGVKLTAGLLLPFALAAPERAGRGRRRLLAGLLGAGVVIIAAGLIAFGSGIEQLPGSVAQSQAAGDWHSIPGALSVKLGFGGLGHVDGDILGLIFGLVSIALLRAVWQGRIDWLDAAALSTLALLVTARSLLPWYIAWLLPLAALARNRRILVSAVVLSGIVQTLALIDYIPHAPATLGL